MTAKGGKRMKGEVSGIKDVFDGMHVIDGAGVHLNRFIGSPMLDHVDPFVLLDEFRSDDPNDYIRGFPWHPHRGIETITYMIDGSFRHQDSKGGGGLMTKGTVQWMTAGRGIIHSEMPAMEEGRLWGYQLWLTLPRKDKMVPPRYQHLSAEMMPGVRSGGTNVKVISGEYGGKKGPADTWFPITYLDVRLDPGKSFRHSVPAEQEKLLYIHSGAVIIDPDGISEEVKRGQLVLLGESPDISVKGSGEESGFLLITGTPLREPIVRGGPFVMNTREEIQKAWEDFQYGRLF